MFYAFGSLLFVIALIAAGTVIINEFATHHRAMMRALSGLRRHGLDGYAPARKATPAARSFSLPTPAPAWKAVA